MANELDSAKFDPLLLRSVARNVAGTLDSFATRMEGLVSFGFLSLSLSLSLPFFHFSSSFDGFASEEGITDFLFLFPTLTVRQGQLGNEPERTWRERVFESERSAHECSLPLSQHYHQGRGVVQRSDPFCFETCHRCSSFFSSLFYLLPPRRRRDLPLFESLSLFNPLF